MCEWEAQEGWVLDPILVGLEKWGKLTNFSNMVCQKVRHQAAGKLVTDVPCEFYKLAVRVNRPNENSNKRNKRNCCAARWEQGSAKLILSTNLLE